AFYLGEDGFYQFDGTSSIPIGSEKVNKSFFRDLDMVYISRISAAIDPINTIVFWAYPGMGNVDGIPNRILAYNWMIRNEDGSVGRWTMIHATCQVLGRTLTEGKTIEQLDGFPVTRNQLSGTDGLPFSLDSRVWMGGKPILAAVNLASCLALATGVGMAATLESAEFEAFPGRMTLVNRVTPLCDGAAVKAAVMSRSSQSDTPMITVPSRSMVGGSLFTRALARYHRLSLTVDEGGFSTMNGVTVEVQAGGIR
ncbi:MAG: hypothetical protein ORO03_06845, partial [Alphaproteobacteria bacterium]|nr:hypothetical protein [Alphaproteobacteria bacterium]